MEKIELTNKQKVEKSLDENYKEALKDDEFKALVSKLKIDESTAKKNTSKLQATICEMLNCKKCKGIYNCSNAVEGHVFFPKMIEGKLNFVYTPCRYQKKHDQEMQNKVTGEKILETARMKDVDLTDKNRVPLIKWLKKFYDEYDKSKNLKGLYLHGSFGSGKTFLIAAIFNELAEKKKANTEIVYFPELLRSIKEDFSIMEEKIDYLKNVDILLIDDIGAENVTNWGRDEILGTILQYRMNSALPTFFTSNLTIEELEHHLSITKNDEDKVKARRIIERIKQLTSDLELISINRRN